MIVVGVKTMESQAVRYRTLAAQAEDHARRTDDLESQRSWLKIADYWTTLASNTEKAGGKSTRATSPTRTAARSFIDR